MTYEKKPTLTWVRGSVDYLPFTVKSNLELDEQTVQITFNRVDFIAAAWTGDAGTTRGAQALVSDDVLPEDQDKVGVFTRVTDDPTAPLVLAGILELI